MIILMLILLFSSYTIVNSMSFNTVIIPHVPEMLALKDQENNCLDLELIDYFSKKSLSYLLKQQIEKKLGLIIAHVITQEKDAYTHTYYEGTALTSMLFGENYEWNRYRSADKYFLDPQSGLPLTSEVRYYYIQLTYCSGSPVLSAYFLGTDYDLLEDKSKAHDMQIFFNAQSGKAEAQLQLGIQLLDKNIEKAELLIRLAVEQDFVSAYYYMGLLEKDYKKNLQEAERWFLLGETKKFSPAITQLGVLYEEKKDIQKAAEYYQKAIEHATAIEQYYDACTEYGLFLWRQANSNDAITWLEIPANSGYTTAQIYLGELYASKDDLENTKRYLELAAKNPDELVTQLNIANIFLDEKNKNKAKTYLQLAAKQNSEEAFFKLGHIYAQCRKYKKAQQWLFRAANGKHGLYKDQALCVAAMIPQEKIIINNAVIEQLKPYAEDTSFLQKVQDFFERRKNNGEVKPAYYLAKLLRKTKKIEEAECILEEIYASKTLEKLEETDLELYLEIHNQLGKIYYKREEFSQALRVLEVNQKYAMIKSYTILARIYQKQNNIVRALTSWRIAAKNNNPQAKMRLDKLLKKYGDIEELALILKN